MPYCQDCGRQLDPETDEHIVIREEHVDPSLGLEDIQGAIYCSDCREPELSELAPTG